ncbi:MAG: hypothetical protein HY895_05700 [Deltaproteobacteria bacterium]|nr:hypothetical protein [Deltaproteobacteria bacterium]
MNKGITADRYFSQTELKQKITILTVCIQKHFKYIHHQCELLERFNIDAEWEMIIVDNSTTGPSDFVLSDPRCKVVCGVPLDHTRPDNIRGSYHHAAALNRYVKEVKTRFLLILDPDLFIIYWNWVNSSIGHMVRNDLCFFGTPWHPRWYSKYRYYPAVHFLLIDLQKVDVSCLDFMPAIVERPAIGDRLLAREQSESLKLTKEQETNPEAVIKPRRFFWNALRYIYRRTPLVFSRHRILSSRDTGWKLWAEFGSTGNFRGDIVLPVVDLSSELTKPKHLQSRWGIRLERLLPLRWSFLPAYGSYVRRKRAHGFELPEFASLKPECFIWRGSPFAFHLRRHVRDMVEMSSNACDEDVMLDRLFAKMSNARCWFAWAEEPSEKT